MALTLEQLKPGKRTKGLRRIGRGSSSTKGNYSGKGIKGQKARQGGRKGLKRFGLKRIIQSLPKMRGFQSQHARPKIVNLDDLAVLTEATITPAVLVSRGLIGHARDGVKVLGNGEVKRAMTITGCTVSASARAKIEAAGGSVASGTKK